MHNGFLTVNGEKMSKSLGNFTTVKDVLDKEIKGEVIRFALLSTHYRSPLDWNEKLLHDAKLTLDKWYRAISGQRSAVSGQFFDALNDDLNIQKAISLMHEATPDELLAMGNMLGLLQQSPEEWFKGSSNDDNSEIESLINERIAAKKAKNWAQADEIRKKLADDGIILEDRPDGTTDWRRS